MLIVKLFKLIIKLIKEAKFFGRGQVFVYVAKQK